MNCSCGAYIPAARRRAGKDDCAGCEAQNKRDGQHYARVNALIDAADNVISINRPEAERHYSVIYFGQTKCLVCGKPAANHGFELTPC